MSSAAIVAPATLDVTVTPQSAYSFANGEIFVRFEESVRGCDAFVLQAHTAPINDQIMEQLIMVDALKRANATNLIKMACFIDSPNMQDIYTYIHGLPSGTLCDLSSAPDWNEPGS